MERLRRSAGKVLINAGKTISPAIAYIVEEAESQAPEDLRRKNIDARFMLITENILRTEHLGFQTTLPEISDEDYDLFSRYTKEELIKVLLNQDNSARVKGFERVLKETEASAMRQILTTELEMNDHQYFLRKSAQEMTRAMFYVEPEGKKDFSKSQTSSLLKFFREEKGNTLAKEGYLAARQILEAYRPKLFPSTVPSQQTV